MRPLLALITFVSLFYSALAVSKDDFHVDGKTLPGISRVIGDVGDSYAGLLSITPDLNNTEKLFFWLWPPAKGAPDQDLTIWFGGGPGCSGLGGMLTEIGPFLLPANHENKTIIKSNPYSWTKAGWVLFIDQPGSVGFSQVTYKDYNETLIASEFSGFLANLYTVFPDLKSKNLYLHGESYAGQFVPHIADHLYNLTAEAAVPIKGIGLVSGGFQSDQWQFHIPAYDYLISRKDDLQLNASAIDALTKRAQGLGLVGYINSTLVYPPAGGPILAPKQYTDEDDKSVTYLALPYLTAANECFNFYDIREKCPSPFSPLVSKDNFINTTPGLKSALHVNESDTWAACTRYKFIFPHEYDPTPPSFEDGSMERVMAKSDRVVMFAGQDDYKIIASGTQLGLQNLTWGGKQGFQEPLTKQLISNGTQVGLYQTERNVTFAVLDHAGHFVPVGQPAMSLKLQQLLLGQIDESGLNSTGTDAQDMQTNGGYERRAWTPWGWLPASLLFAF